MELESAPSLDSDVRHLSALGQAASQLRGPDGIKDGLSVQKLQQPVGVDAAFDLDVAVGLFGMSAADAAAGANASVAIVTDVAPRLQAHWEQQLSDAIWIYIPPLLILFGTIGNVLIIYVMNKPPYKVTIMGFYVVLLAVSDTTVLNVGLLRYYIEKLFEVDLRQIGSAVCKGHLFVTVVAMDMSVWLLATATVERFIDALYAHCYLRFCGARSGRFVTFALFVIAILVNAHLFFTRDLVAVGKEILVATANGTVESVLIQKYRCETTKATAYFSEIVLPWVVFCIYSLVPFSVIIVSNVGIVRVIMAQRSASRRSGAARRVLPSQSGGTAHSSSPRGSCDSGALDTLELTQVRLLHCHDHRPVTTLATPLSASPTHTNAPANNRLQPFVPPNQLNPPPPPSQNTGATAMMLTVSIIFLVSCFPTIIRKIVEPYWTPTTPKQRANYELVLSIVKILQYLQHAINFLVYCLASAEFRTILVLNLRKTFANVCCKSKIRHKEHIKRNGQLEALLESSLSSKAVSSKKEEAKHWGQEWPQRGLKRAVVIANEAADHPLRRACRSPLPTNQRRAQDAMSGARPLADVRALPCTHRNGVAASPKRPRHSARTVADFLFANAQPASELDHNQYVVAHESPTRQRTIDACTLVEYCSSV